MTVLPLVLALVAAAPTSEGRAFAADMAFEAVTVDWLAENRLVRNLDHCLPRREALLVRQLNCDSSSCRELARDELAGMGRGAADAILWGLRVESAETRNSCRILMSRLCLCRECGGTGEVSKRYGEVEYLGTCSGCDSSGDIRLKRQWDEGREVLVPVELFPMRMP